MEIQPTKSDYHIRSLILNWAIHGVTQMKESNSLKESIYVDYFQLHLSNVLFTMDQLLITKK